MIAWLEEGLLYVYLTWKVYLQLINDHIFLFDSLEW